MMEQLHLQQFTDETGLMGRPLTSGRNSDFGIWLEPDGAKQERTPISTNTVISCIRGYHLQKFTQCVLSPHGVVGMRVDDPWTLVDKLFLSKFRSNVQRKFLHWHAASRVLISSALANTGPAQTVCVNNDTYLHRLLQYTETHSSPVSARICASIKCLLLEKTTGFSSSEIYPVFSSVTEMNTYTTLAFSELQQNGYSHEWGHDELLVIDNHHVLHGPDRECYEREIRARDF